jgi:hypothetical protein
MVFDPIRVISRPKKNGVGTHFGVHFPNGVVYDFTFDEGLRQITLDQFSEGARVVVVREIPWHMMRIVRARLDELGRNPRTYNLLAWNCETFAEWLASGVSKSEQVVDAILLGGIIIALAYAYRN